MRGNPSGFGLALEDGIELRGYRHVYAIRMVLCVERGVTAEFLRDCTPRSEVEVIGRAQSIDAR